MFVLWSWLVVALVASAGVAQAQRSWPSCHSPGRGVCASGDPHRRGGWAVRQYAVNGKRLSVSYTNGTLRWQCSPGAYDHAAPRFTGTVPVQALEFHCQPPSNHYFLVNLLSVSTAITKLSLSLNGNQHFQTRFLSGLRLTELSIHSEQLVKLEGTSNLDSIKKLLLDGISIDRKQLHNLTGVEELALVGTGLEELPDLEPLTKLWNLVIKEPLISNVSRLASAPALIDLTLEAPDAALVSLPKLKKATFLNIYMMERIFGECDELEELSLLGGWLGKIRPGWLDGCIKLRRLRLSGLSNLRLLPDKLLTDATLLTELNLSGNSLDTLPDDLLRSNPELARLDLSHNWLQALPEGFLAHNAKLMYLDVSHNALIALPPDLVAKLILHSSEEYCAFFDISNNNYSADFIGDLPESLYERDRECLVM